MKRGNSQLIERSVIGADINLTTFEEIALDDVDTSTGIDNLHVGRQSSQPTEYPAGSIGRNLLKRNYVNYLVQRYYRFREAGSSFGSGEARFSYAVVFKNIERKFKAPTYFVSEARFPGLVKHLQRLIDGTILGKRNLKRGICNYQTLDEYEAEQFSGKKALS